MLRPAVLLGPVLLLAAMASPVAAQTPPAGDAPPAEAPAGSAAPAPGPAPAPAPAAPGTATAQPVPAPPPPAYPPPAYPPPGGYAQPGQPAAPAYPAPAYGPAYPGYGPPGAGMYVQTEPPPPPGPPPGEHLHDGFYLRMSLGGGYLHSTVASDVGGVQDVNVKGGGAGLDLLLGGTPTPGLVLGGGIFATGATDPTLESGGQSQDLNGDASLAFIGPFVDGFFDPEGGLHLGGAIGFASFTVKEQGQSSSDAPQYDGAGIAVFGGYDAWVSSDWSLGGYVRFMAANGKRQEDVLGVTYDEKATTWGFALMFTALYH